MTDKQAKSVTFETWRLAFVKGRNIMREGLADPGTWEAYHATVAMIIHDRTMEKRNPVMNETATEILNVIFGMGRHP